MAQTSQAFRTASNEYMRRMMLPLPRGILSASRSMPLFGKRRRLGPISTFNVQGAFSPDSAAGGGALPCAVCGGGGIGRTCGWCRGLSTRGAASSGGFAMASELARFNSSFLLDPVEPPAPAPSAAAASACAGGSSPASSAPVVPVLGQVGGDSLVDCEVELVVSQLQRVRSVGEPGGRLDDEAAASALLPLLQRSSSSSSRQFYAYARMMPLESRDEEVRVPRSVGSVEEGEDQGRTEGHQGVVDDVTREDENGSKAGTPRLVGEGSEGACAGGEGQRDDASSEVEASGLFESELARRRRVRLWREERRRRGELLSQGAVQAEGVAVSPGCVRAWGEAAGASVQASGHPGAEEAQRGQRRMVEVVVRGRASQVRHVARVLRRAGLQVRVPPALAARYGVVESKVEQAQVGASSQAALERIFDNLANESSAPALHARVDDDALASAGIRSTLYRHQKEGVSWMLRCELRGSDSESVGRGERGAGADGEGARGRLDDGVAHRAQGAASLPPLWQETSERSHQEKQDDTAASASQEVGFCDVITNTSQAEPPPQVRGGLVCDDMGLGKTIQVLSVILANAPRHKVADRGSPLRAGGPEHAPINVEEASLVVCPMSVITSWETQARQHTRQGSLRVTILHPSRVVSTLVAGAFHQQEPGGGGEKEKPSHNVPAIPAITGDDSVAGIETQDLVLVSYESLRSMYKRFLLQNASEYAATSTVGNHTPINHSSMAADAELLQGKQKDEVVSTEGELEGGRGWQRDGERDRREWKEQEAHEAGSEDASVALAHGADEVDDMESGAAGDVKRARGGDDRASDEVPGVAKVKRNRRAQREVRLKAAQRMQETIRALFTGRWRRVVLDEAHVIKNRHSQNFKACVALAATHRWCLTGTPLQNSADDVQALMAFLRVEPLANFGIWREYIGKPIRGGDPLGLARLRVAMRAVSLRRSNAVLADSLPPITVLTHSVRMGDAERYSYDVLFASARAAFMALDAHGGTAVMQQYTSVLECLLRLRQACSSGLIVPPARLARARQVLQQLTGSDDPYAAPAASNASAVGEPVVKANLTAEEAAKILKTLTAIQEAQQLEGEAYTCAVCLEDLSDAAARRVLRVCAHAFCADCLQRLLDDAEEATRERERSAGGASISSTASSAACPLCRAAFTRADVFSASEMANSSASLGAQTPAARGALKAAPGVAESSSKEDVAGSEPADADADRSQGTTEVEVREPVCGGSSPSRVGNVSTSAKILALVADLEDALDNSDEGGWAEDGGEDDGRRRCAVKAVVFSQFLGCLDEVAGALTHARLPFARLQGKMTLDERRRVLAAFQEPSGPCVLLVSTKAGGVGLSLTAASRVYMMDLWWNAAVDQQAMQRVHRIGQTRPVTVVRFLCQDTIEQHILEMQERKDWLGKAALRVSLLLH